MKNIIDITKKLIENHSLTLEEYEFLIENRNDKNRKILQNEADRLRKEVYGNKIFIRGLIEISNICKNDCYYCGIRKSNKNCDRYRLNKEDILNSCKAGYDIGFRTFVLQGGEDGFFTDEVLCEIIGEIKQKYPDCAVTLSLGERTKESYQKLKTAGADRYLLRHETADKDHYGKLHPKELSFENRIACLKNLKELGFQVGCGFMVGSPFQTIECMAKDLKFIEEFSPDMCGIGPFIPHKDTYFANEKQGEVELTCYLLSIIRIIKPNILLPATTALGTIDENGREKGILSGANVVMPNLTPITQRSKYTLYNNKLITGGESAENINLLKEKFKKIGFEISADRGDIKII
ncbi:MAG: [FeFe] hydrogenase H-cluster radical SAM maturase HydE [Acutalibacteraceae bacterium]